jgi:hypothetical protein
MRRGNASLLLPIARFELIPNCQNEHDVLGREPSVFRYVAMAAAREHEFPSPVLCAATEERMMTLMERQSLPSLDAPISNIRGRSRRLHNTPRTS